MSAKAKQQAVFITHGSGEEEVFDLAKMLAGRSRGLGGWSHNSDFLFMSGAHQVPVQLLLQESISKARAGEAPDIRVDNAIREALTETLILLSSSGAVLNSLTHAGRLAFGDLSMVASPAPNRDWAAELKRLAGAITSVASEAFEGLAASISIGKAKGDGERPVVVTLDFTKHDRGEVSRAREGGARARFYDAILEQLPQDLADATDFEFVFPVP